MSDLDKLMGKLKKGKDKPEEEPTLDAEEDDEEEVEETEEEMEDDDEDDEEQEEEEEKPKPAKKVKTKDEPIQAQEEDQHSVESEVALLQNDGIFRRELILTLKEMVDVQKVQAQTLIDIKKRLLDEDATEKQ